MFVLSTIIGSVSGHKRGVFNSLGDYLFQIVFAIALALTLVTIAALHTVQRSSDRYGRTGAIGALTTFIGYALIVVVTTLAIPSGNDSLHNVRLIGAFAVLSVQFC
jgi:cytochrome bd-type quinol oxidase subunit 2